MKEKAQQQLNVVFTPVGIKVDTLEGMSVLDAARKAGVDLDSVCGGRGLCGRCQITPVEGYLAKWDINSSSNSLSPPEPTEQNYKGKRPLSHRRRLGCQARILDNLVIDIPEESQIHRPVVCKDIDLGDVTLDPAVTLHYIQTPTTALGEETSNAANVKQALQNDWNLEEVNIGIPVLRDLETALRTGEQAMTIAVHNRKRVLGVRAGYSDAAYGVAIDVGSTTLAGYLVDLSNGEVLATNGQMNPQIRFGEDLMSRVSYAMMNSDGTASLTAAVREAINSLISELCNLTDTNRDHLHELVVVGNPIMHHLVLGINPMQLGTAPFTLTISEAVKGRATDIGVRLPNAALYVAPCIAGHVGADTAAMVLAERPHHSKEPVLIVDVGTNAEIVLGNRRQLLAASSPTGPAFEGAQISCGQRATAGAIEKVRIDPQTFEPHFKVIGCDLWSNEPGFTAALAKKDLTISGVCGSGIIEAVAEMFLAGIINQQGVINPLGHAANQDNTTKQDSSTNSQPSSRSQPPPRIVAEGRTYSYILQHEPIRLAITQNDVRAIQLAKAALRAGIDLLCEHSGITQLASIRLTGAFGAHLNPTHTMLLGMIPDAPIENVQPVGNAAGIGAVRMLLSNHQKAEIEQTVRTIEKIETATEPRFQELFVNAMAFPHNTAPTPNLAKVVKLPAPTPQQGRTRTSRRKRRTTIPLNNS